MSKKPSKNLTVSGSGEFLVYQTDDGRIKLEVRLENETLWLTQKTIAELFGTSVDNAGLHLKNIYSEGELDETATTEDFSVVQKEGQRAVRRTLKFYNLDAIISVGYWVKSIAADRRKVEALEEDAVDWKEVESLVKELEGRYGGENG